MGPSAPSAGGGCPLGYSRAPSSLSKNSMPVQWNEVSSGTVDALASPGEASACPQGNLAVYRPKPAFGQYPGYNPQGLQASPGGLDNSQLHALQPYSGASSTPRANYTQQLRQPGAGSQCPNVTAAVNPTPATAKPTPAEHRGQDPEPVPLLQQHVSKPGHLGLPQQMELLLTPHDGQQPQGARHAQFQPGWDATTLTQPRTTHSRVITL